MLSIQKFLFDHPEDWKERLSSAPYFLKIKESGDLIIFNYNMYNSDFSLDITKEARGLILEKGTWKVIRMAFYKFFNLGEPNAASIDWSSATATSKEDGNIISLYYYNNKWNVASNSCIDAAEAHIENIGTGYSNLLELFNEAAKNSGLNYNKLDPQKTYTFELVSPCNRIVVKYDDTKLFHILTRDNNTLEEIDKDIGIETPRFYAFNNRDDYLQLVKSLGNNHEGIVIKDKFNNRVKLKTEEYIRLHYMAGEMALTLENAVYIIWNHEQNEYLQYFPEAKKVLDNIEKQLNSAEEKIKSIIKDVNSKTWENSKAVYDYYCERDKQFVDLYVAEYNGRLDSNIRLLKNCNEKNINKYIENYDRIADVINNHQWKSSEEAFKWALKHDSVFSAAYPEIYNKTFDSFIKKLKKSGSGKYLKKFDIKI